MPRREDEFTVDDGGEFSTSPDIKLVISHSEAVEPREPEADETLLDYSRSICKNNGVKKFAIRLDGERVFPSDDEVSQPVDELEGVLVIGQYDVVA